MFHLKVSTTFQNVHKTHKIAVHIGLGIFYAVTHPCLGGQIAHLRKSVFFEQAGKQVPVFQGHTYKGEPWVHRAYGFHMELGSPLPAYSQLFQAVKLEVYIIIVIDSVQAYHGIPLFNKGQR